MFGMQYNMVPKTVIVLPEKEASSASSVKSGKSGKSGKSINGGEGTADNQSTHNSTTTSSKFGGLFKSNSIRSASISSGVSGTPSSHQRGMGALTEEDGVDSKQHYQPEPLDIESYRQCLHWLQQTCRPVFMKELTQVKDVPVPITEENAKHPSLIGGSQQVQVGSWKQSQVQLVPIDRWGDPQDVLQEVSPESADVIILVLSRDAIRSLVRSIDPSFTVHGRTLLCRDLSFLHSFLLFDRCSLFFPSPFLLFPLLFLSLSLLSLSLFSLSRYPQIPLT
jgi:hypothetical protein